MNNCQPTSAAPCVFTSLLFGIRCYGPAMIIPQLTYPPYC